MRSFSFAQQRRAVWRAIVASMVIVTSGSADAAVISYVGKIADTTDYNAIGNAGFWFPRFGLTSPQTGLARDLGSFTASLPTWALLTTRQAPNARFPPTTEGLDQREVTALSPQSHFQTELLVYRARHLILDDQ